MLYNYISLLEKYVSLPKTVYWSTLFYLEGTMYEMDRLPVSYEYDTTYLYVYFFVICPNIVEMVEKDHKVLTKSIKFLYVHQNSRINAMHCLGIKS